MADLSIDVEIRWKRPVFAYIGALCSECLHKCGCSVPAWWVVFIVRAGGCQIRILDGEWEYVTKEDIRGPMAP